MAAHNEEKIIARTLQHILSLPYRNYEIIVGLDGCTDNTEKIVKNFAKTSKRIRYYSLNLRKGKPAVINAIVKKAKGEIIIINDADWLFDAASVAKIKKMLGVFDDSSIGGIAMAYPVEWTEEKINNSNLGYRMTAYATYFWMEFQKNNYTYKKNGLLYLKEPNMFMTNILRKKLYKPNESLGDDFERTMDIMKSGYNAVMFDDLSMPRMQAAYKSIKVKDVFNQKVRTAKAREQIAKKGNSIGAKYYFKSVSYIIKNSFKMGFSIGLMCLLWTAITATASIKALFTSFNTKKGWTMRAQR